MVHAWYVFHTWRRFTVLPSVLCFLMTTVLSGCLTSPIVELRTQQYSTTQNVVLLSTNEIENNLVQYHARCGNGRWMKPAKEGAPRQMVWGKQLDARTFRVDAWIDFEPLGSGRTQVTAYSTPATQRTVFDYLSIIVDPGTCR
ncbi:hypothetical protein N1030_05455 [Desulfovibrio mangrovi]|uniref:hypothetical protein n=1 Tax=Desulfovibrio mangrovi TaxID=2976983 RepID=UPI002247E8CE|nr:hypothetical protein [Desulfovibrio mangrovi]UZP68422.1 hypothetical protein N1030_05455 [Desulfovibrio mangrovi]